MPDETVTTRAPDIAAELQAFNEARRQVLRNHPISPEGERVLGRLLSDPPEEDGPYKALDR